jgi:hypothetical protein
MACPSVPTRWHCREKFIIERDIPKVGTLERVDRHYVLDGALGRPLAKNAEPPTVNPRNVRASLGMDSLRCPSPPCVPQMFNTPRCPWFRRQSSNDCGDNLYSSARRNLTRFRVLATDHNSGVGAMRWKFTFDHDDLTLAVAALVSALAISLALI